MAMSVVRGFLLCLQALQFVDVQAGEWCFFHRNLYCSERCCGGISKEYCCPHPSQESRSSIDIAVIVVIVIISAIGLSLCVGIVCACISYWKREGRTGGQVYPQGHGPATQQQGPQTQPALPYGIRPVSGLPAFGIRPPAYDEVPPMGTPRSNSKATDDPPPPYSQSDPVTLPGCVPEATTSATAQASTSPPPYRVNSRSSTAADARSP